MSRAVPAHCAADLFIRAARYTAVVTLGPRTWTTPWSAFFAAVDVGLGPIFYSVVSGLILITWGLPTVELSRRLYRRAVKLALFNFIREREVTLAKSGPDSSPNPNAPQPEPLYVALHRSLAAEWMSRADILSGAKGLLLSLSIVSFVGALVYVATGNCLPAWTVAAVGVTLLDVVRGLFIAAASNAAVTDVSHIYALARTRVQEILAGADPVVLGSPAARSLYASERLVASFSDVDKYRGVFLGFRVSYASARGAAITLFTVLAGVATILRGSGWKSSLTTFTAVIE